VTVKDLVKRYQFPSSSKDGKGRLIAAAAVGTSSDTVDRASGLKEEEVDVVVIDTAHGHSRKVMDMVVKLRGILSDVELVVGNVATAEAVRDLAELGVDAIKVGIGPGSICHYPRYRRCGCAPAFGGDELRRGGRQTRGADYR